MIETLQQFVFSSNLKLKLLISLFILLLISMSFCGSYCQVYARKLLWFCTFWPQLGNPVWHILMPQEMWESLRRIHRLYLKFLVTYRHVKHFYLHLSELQLVSDISDFILNDFPFFLFPREHFSSSIEQFRKSFLVKTSFLFNLEFLYKFDLILIFNQFFLCYPCDASLKPKKLSSEELLGQEWHGSRKLTELLDILCFGSCVLSCQ